MNIQDEIASSAAKAMVQKRDDAILAAIRVALDKPDMAIEEIRQDPRFRIDVMQDGSHTVLHDGIPVITLFQPRMEIITGEAGTTRLKFTQSFRNH